jgi:tRNA (guanine37-N1)-methyltransferase
MLEVSLGDFILSGGEIAALAILDACIRLLPEVIGNENALAQESFSSASEYARLLEYPHYTRPPVWNGKTVPDVLLSGNHAEIERWRLEQAKLVTRKRRPDLLNDKC